LEEKVMMTVEERTKMYKDKKTFIDNISRALELSNTTVMRVDYEVYSRYNPEYDTTYYAEFAVVTFTGGAKSVRTISGNSDSANFREIGKLLDGGYYDENRYYEDVVSNCEKVNLEG
jgi:hypothetical protein